MTNRTTLAQLVEMEPAELHSIPLDHIAMLLEDVTQSKAIIRTAEARLNEEMLRRFGAAADATRKAMGKDSGTVTIMESGYRIRADRVKRVAWDQAKLAEAAAMVAGWGESTDEYLTIERKVAENKYTAWPAAIRHVFEPARTVSVGPATFKIEREAA